eukprot:TRINITY_DN22238_c0_g1_i1.p1 TRINITY_DN22238_c0_g1~~TRINITY_DN22238_c0_g1_i1.p1  ORF type:complete len:700 (+),score=64.41 TRINITY_DN22238_c0_g1_i1:29-2101(+)
MVISRQSHFLGNGLSRRKSGLQRCSRHGQSPKRDKASHHYLQDVESAVEQLLEHLREREQSVSWREQAVHRHFSDPETHGAKRDLGPDRSIPHGKAAEIAVDDRILAERATYDDHNTDVKETDDSEPVLMCAQSCQKVILRSSWKETCADSESFDSEVELSVTTSLKRNQKTVPLDSAEESMQMCKTDSIHQAQARLLIHPAGKFRIGWNIFGVCLILYDVLMTPLQVAFALPHTAFFSVVEYMGTSFWLADMLVSFRLAYYDGPSLVLCPSRIARRYARTWLGVDLSLVLLEILTLVGERVYGGTVLRMTRAVRVLRCVRVTRAARMQWLLLKFEDVIATDLLMLVWVLVKMTIGLLIAIHISTCGWYLIGRLTPDGWTTTWYEHLDESRRPDSFPHDVIFWYTASARWMLAQLNGKTDDDVRRNMPEMAYTSVIAVVFPVIVMALFISSITQTLGRLGATAEEGARRRKLVCKFLEAHKIEGKLVSEVKRSVASALSEEDFDQDMSVEAEVVDLLPKHLQGDLLFQIRSPLICMHPIFLQLKSAYPRALRHICLHGFQHVSAHRNEKLFQRGDSCDTMFFLSQGKMHYVQGDDFDAGFEADDGDLEIGEMLSRGIWLCEPALFVDWTNCGTLEAAASSSLLSLTADALERTLRDYKAALKLVAAYAHRLAKELNRLEKFADLMPVLVN